MGIMTVTVGLKYKKNSSDIFNADDELWGDNEKLYCPSDFAPVGAI